MVSKPRRQRFILSIVVPVVAICMWRAIARADLTILDLRANTAVFNSTPAPAGNGDTVAQWQDQSGFGNHATVPSSPITSVGPVFNSTGFAGAPSIDFAAAAANARLALTTPLITNQPYWKIRTTVNATTALSVDEVPIVMNYGFGNAFGWELMAYRDRFEFYVGFSVAPDPNNRLLSPTFVDGTWHDIEIQRFYDSYTMLLDGVVVDTDTYVGNFTGLRNLTIGNGSDYNSSAHALDHMASLTIVIPEPATLAVVAVILPWLVRRRR